ncbi:MAG: 16S rRNA (guanine(527)-N(7))-methyltransferase RsmG [Mycobacteriales bacterium]
MDTKVLPRGTEPPADTPAAGSPVRPVGPVAPPDVAARVFGPALDRAIAYAEMLATDGTVRGLIGPREVSRLWDRHLLNSAVVAELVPAGASVVDAGSGAGLPGIPLALARPDLTVTLLEPLARRHAFLTECAGRLGLDTVTVVRGRAEEGPVRRALRGADVVTARAVAPLDRLAGWCLPLLRAGGLLLAVKGDTAEDELTAARPALARAGASTAEVVRCGAGVVDPPATVVVVTRGTVRTGASGRQRGGRVR